MLPPPPSFAPLSLPGMPLVKAQPPRAMPVPSSFRPQVSQMVARRSTFLGCVALFSLFATRYSGPFHAIAFGSKSPDLNFPLALAVTSIWS